jgi:predicted MFS family arabinose efflux permease
MSTIATAERTGSYRVMGLIGVAHSASHFYHLVLPALFPLIKDDLGVGYAELGLLTTLMFIVSGICQPIAGFAVDRFGARPTLFAGLGLFAGAILLAGLAPNYWTLAVLMPIAGIGNSVFHPADYAILSGSIERGRLGRAYGFHTLGGNIGWAAAPASMLALASVFDWRTALVIAGFVGIAILVALLSQSSYLDDGRAAHRRLPKSEKPKEENILRVLFSLSILLCFVYFVMIAIASIGLQSFLPGILDGLYGTPLEVASAALTGFLVGSSVGTTASMVFADRIERHHLVVTFGLTISAAVVFYVAEVKLGAFALTAFLFVAGFALGVTTPSRDLVVRQATPPGATGRVFGFVYSGLDAGSAIAPVLIGLLIDHHLAGEALWMASVAFLVCVGIANWLERLAQRD